jgi:hypothetical protein
VREEQIVSRSVSEECADQWFLSLAKASLSICFTDC